MNLKRVAGVINLIAAVVFITVGLKKDPVSATMIVIGGVFFLLGLLRLWQTKSAPPPSGS
jgi:hypothetical protein